MKLKDKLSNLPDKSGAYLMKDKEGKVIYVGKAQSLKKRVGSYFHSARGFDAKTRVLVDHIADFDYLVTDSEIEALILECNLIKEHRPRYNVRLRDDKKYPFITCTLNEDYPRLFMTRKIKENGG